MTLQLDDTRHEQIILDIVVRRQILRTSENIEQHAIQFIAAIGRIILDDNILQFIQSGLDLVMAAAENLDTISTVILSFEQCTDIREHNPLLILHVFLYLLHILIIITENRLSDIAPRVDRLNQFTADRRQSESQKIVMGVVQIGNQSIDRKNVVSDTDRMILFVGIDDAADLLSLPWGSATAVFGWGPDAFDQKKLVESIRDALPFLRVVTWEEENQQLLGVLAVEKNMMFFLLIFIVLVAAFSIMNTLITSVYQKTREIGILKALGASDRCVTFIFILQGVLIGVIGSVTGTLTGVLVIFYRNDIMEFASKTFHVELFPKQFYFFDGLPAHIVATDVLIIVGASVVLCTLGALLPALRAARLDPARALRYE